MKPICKAEARHLFWRIDYVHPKHKLDPGFSQYEKKQMARARRRHLNDQAKREAA